MWTITIILTMLVNGANEMIGDSFITDMVVAVGYESMV